MILCLVGMGLYVAQKQVVFMPCGLGNRPKRCTKNRCLYVLWPKTGVFMSCGHGTIVAQTGDFMSGGHGTKYCTMSYGHL